MDRCYSGNGRIMLSCKGPKWTLPITSYYSLELLWCFILRIRVMIFNPRTMSIRDSSGTASEMAILLKMLYPAAEKIGSIFSRCFFVKRSIVFIISRRLKLVELS